MHSLLIRRCLELAERGRGRVSPNPLVGCVITDAAGNVLGEGWHEKFGGPHAEVNAIEKALPLLSSSEPEGRVERLYASRRSLTASARRELEEATLYVNLEPCSHHGKTPPCTEAIVKAGIKKVVFGARDPLHGSAEMLRGRGVEVVGPVLEAECRYLNRGFFSIVEQGRPWVTLKKAVPRECSALLRGRCVVNIPRVPRLKITSEEQDMWVHQRLRATHDAILVGSGTILADDPKLNVRYNLLPTPYNLQPRRVILDPHSEIPATANVLSDEEAARTLVIHEKLPIPKLLERLRQEGITSVIVEGGPRVWQSFEQSALYDETVILVGHIPSPKGRR